MIVTFPGYPVSNVHNYVAKRSGLIYSIDLRTYMVIVRFLSVVCSLFPKVRPDGEQMTLSITVTMAPSIL